MIIIDEQGISDNIDRKIETLERLIADLEAIRAGRGPTAADLASAPVLDRYRAGFIPLPCLSGEMQGHPTIADGPGRTSDIWVLAVDRGWIRTYSRYYALGRPFGDENRLWRRPDSRDH